jgi:hypothetical protein
MAARILIVDDHEMVRRGPTVQGMSEQHPGPQRQRDGDGVSLVVPDKGKGISAEKLSEIQPQGWMTVAFVKTASPLVYANSYR